MLNAVISVPSESLPGENRVALVPNSVASLKTAGFDVIVQSGAGSGSFFRNQAYEDQGAIIEADRSEVLSRGDVILTVNGMRVETESWERDLDALRPSATLIGLLDPDEANRSLRRLAERDISLFALELLPRITRTQQMDALSSMATVAGYAGAILGATEASVMFPMMMTAAGTLTPARVLVLGAGVAGLQAIATAKRLGAVVHAHDVRPTVRQQVESLGATYVSTELESTLLETTGGYAAEQSQDFQERQRALLIGELREANVVITAAQVPGHRAPILITRDGVAAMKPGSVIVDLAAERSGNCEMTEPGRTVVHDGVKIIGPLNLPSRYPQHASQMYSRNISSFALHTFSDGRLAIDESDEIVAAALVAKEGRLIGLDVATLAAGG